MKLTEQEIENMFENWVESEDTRNHKDNREGYFANNNNFTRDHWIADKAFKAAISLLLPIIEKQNKALIEASNALINHYHPNNLDSPLNRIEVDIVRVEQMIKELGNK